MIIMKQRGLRIEMKRKVRKKNSKVKTKTLYFYDQRSLLSSNQMF